MNQKFLLLISGLLFSFNVSAQTEFKVGLHGGLNYPDVWGNEYAKYQDFKIGYLLGVSLEQPLSKNLSVKANLNYERKIKKFEIIYYDYNAEEDGRENFRQVYEYINVPVLVKYEFGNSGIFVNAGPFLNYLFSEQIKPNDPFDSDIPRPEQKKLDFGLSAGAGVAITLDNKNEITIEIRDDLGLTDIGGVPAPNSDALKTNTIKLILGWNMGL